MLREHLQVPGMGRTTASYFRDKLAMRTKARSLGIPVPEFSPVFNDQALDDWTRRVPAPWVLKPRSSAAAIGIKKIADRDELWRALDAAGDQRSNSVLEQFVSRRRLPRRLDHLGRDGRVCDSVQVRPAADGNRPPGWSVHHPTSARRFAGRRGAAGVEPQVAGRARTPARRFAQRIHRPRRQIRGAGLSRNLRASRRRVHRRHDRGRDRTQPVGRVGEDRDRRPVGPVHRAAAPRRLRRHRAVAGAAGGIRTCRRIRTPRS